MDNQLINSIIKKYQFSKKQIEAVLTLLEEKKYSTIYCEVSKRATGGLDEVQIKQIDDEYQYGQLPETRSYQKSGRARIVLLRVKEGLFKTERIYNVLKTYIGLLNKRKRQGQLRRNVKG